MGSVKFELFKSKRYKDGRHPILIRITHDRTNKYLNTHISAFEEEWDFKSNQVNERYRKNFSLNKPTFDKINLNISNLYNKARGIISKLEENGRPYTIFDIIKYLDKSAKPTTFCDYTQKLVDDMFASGKLGNASNYQTVLNSVKSFTNDKDIALDKVNYRWLSDFEKYYLQKQARINEKKKSLKSNPINGLNVYMRAIRAILNKAIKDGFLEEGANPFGRNGYEIQRSPVIKRAINKEKIDTIRKFDVPENTSLWHTKNYFLFSFNCRGMTWVDMANLKLSNIIDGRIEYVRIKTIRKNSKSFSIKITPQIQQILDYYILNKKGCDYIFPIVKRDDPVEKRKDIKNELKNFNKYLKKLGKECGIEKNMTSYVARHSWGTIAKKELHFSTSVISEGYGHQDEATTKAYLDDFDDDEIDNANDLITA
jgi:integrase/recombinase XerD